MTDTTSDPFEDERPRLTGIAYRMLGSISDAEDVVQEAWLRWQRQEEATIENPAAWLTTVTTRLALDRQRSVDRRREDYVGPWLPEPVAVERTPEQAAELADSLTLGFLVVLDRLSPTDRAVFVLADVFGEPYRTIATTVGKSEEACRQIASRARKRVREHRDHVAPADEELLGKLLLTLSAGDEAAFVNLLHPDAVFISDGGPNQRAARRPIVGATRIVRFLLNTVGREPVTGLELATLNGALAVVLTTDQRTVVLQAETEDGRVRTITLVSNPDKLHGIGHPVDLR